MRFYSKDKLLQVARDRGYMTIRAIADGLAPIFGQKPVTIKSRLGSGNLSKEECEVIGSYFEMTMKEYYDVFMNGLFQEDMNGHYVCHVDKPYVHLHPGVATKHASFPSGASNCLAEKKKRKTADEIIEQLTNL